MGMQDFFFKMARYTWGAKKREAFYRRTAAMVENGMPLAESIETLRDRAKRRFMSWDGDPDVIAMSDIVTKIQNGASFVQSIDGWVPRSDLALIGAGEMSGQLPEVLRVCIEAGKVVKRLRAKIFVEMFDPVLFAGVGFYLIYVIGSQMVPAMRQALPVSRWPAAAKPLLPMGEVATSGLVGWLLLALLFLAVLSFATMGSWGRRGVRIRTFLDRIPPWSIYRVIQGASWVVGFSNLLQAGVRVIDALKLQAQYAPNWLKIRLEDTIVHVANGHEIGQALRMTGYNFPDVSLIEDIQAFARFKNFPELVRKLGDEWLADAEEKILGAIKAFAAFFNISVNLVIVAVVIGMNALQSVISSQH